MRPGSFFLFVFLGSMIQASLLSSSSALADGMKRDKPVPQKPVSQPPAPPQAPPVIDESLKYRLNPNSLDQYRVSMGVTALRQQLMNDIVLNTRRKIKVAVLDRGFAGWEERVGKSIPRDTKYHAGAVKIPETTAHGSLMAEMLTSMVWGGEWETPVKNTVPFELSLYNVAGFSNLKAAIDAVIRQKVDLVLYSEVWELGGNSDGAGFINREVDRATKAGIIWINAAGNFGGRTYNAPVDIGQDNLVQLPDERNSLELTCQPPRGVDICPVKITLNWNDFKNDPKKGTTKNLDLALLDSDFKKVQIADQEQVDIAGEAQGKQSKYPRESIVVQLKKGTYHLMVRATSKDWDENDRMRILVDGDSVTLAHGETEESLQNPADNAGVITVGASDSDRSSASKSLGKPELMAPSNVMEFYGKQFRGSSNSAALVMGKAILLKYADNSLDRESMIQALLVSDQDGTQDPQEEYLSMSPYQGYYGQPRQRYFGQQPGYRNPRSPYGQNFGYDYENFSGY